MISIISLIFPKNFLNYLWRYFGLGIFGKSIIYYFILIMSSMLGSMIGINKRKAK